MKLVYSYYVLDIVHKGHLLMMKNAKSIAGKDGKLIVGILTDEAVMEKKKDRYCHLTKGSNLHMR